MKHKLAPIFVISLLASAVPQSGMAQTEAELLQDIAALQQQVSLLEAQEEIENLQRIYGFYIDKHLWQQAADLFTADGEIEIGGSGVYRGRARVLEYLRSLGAEGPQEGILNDHMQLMPVITVNTDGTASGRWQHFSQQAVHGESHHLGTGVYQVDYVYQDGHWMIQRLQRFTRMRTPYGEGWHKQALARSTPSASLPPDAPPSVDYENYPLPFVAPFHYPHPVTGEQRVLADPEPVAAGQAESVLADLQQRLTRLSDLEAVERLQTVYGYYLARNQWDDLTGLFAEEGEIEIAMRGVYIGRESVRRNLNLYGVQDQLPGELHNHMQYQPVIHLSEDGQTARLRSRAFSMMGNYGRDGRWMGGTYENIYIKRDGVWQILRDQQFNTYFASYDNGWINLDRYQPPGITEANPPDAPPTHPFEMYPKAFLPPFHYQHPITGR